MNKHKKQNILTFTWSEDDATFLREEWDVENIGDFLDKFGVIRGESISENGIVSITIGVCTIKQ